jgi:Na+-driven multidrug efflux pump
MAANQALLAIEALAFPIAEGFGVAAAALSAQKMGAGRPEAALRTARSAARMAAIGLAIFGMSLALAPGAWMSAFTGDAGVASLGRASIYAAAAAQPFMAFAVVATAALRGAGRTSTALAITLVCGVGVRLGATWLLSMTLGMGLAGAWLASALDWMSQALLVTVVLERGSLHGSFASDVALVPRGNPAC